MQTKIKTKELYRRQAKCCKVQYRLDHFVFDLHYTMVCARCKIGLQFSCTIQHKKGNPMYFLRNGSQDILLYP